MLAMARWWFHTVFWDQHRNGLMIPIDYSIFFSNWVESINHVVSSNEEIYDQPGDFMGHPIFNVSSDKAGVKGYSGGCSTVSNEHINHHNDA
jgi:hypothetical protein